MRVPRTELLTYEIVSRPTRAHSLAQEIYSSSDREAALNRAFGTPGHRKALPLTLRKAVYKKLAELDENNSRLSSLREETHTSTAIRTSDSYSAPKPVLAVSKAASPSSVDNGKEIYSKNGVVTGGRLIPGKAYDVSYGRESIFNNIKLTGVSKKSDRNIYYFEDGSNLNDYDPVRSSTGFKFVEIQKSETKEKIIFTPTSYSPENRDNILKLRVNDMYEVHQPKTGSNFNGMLYHKEIIDGFTVLFFVGGITVDSSDGAFTVQKV